MFERTVAIFSVLLFSAALCFVCVAGIVFR